jgi:hypothetical protein
MSKKDKGLFIGESHDNGGIPSMVKETGQLIEIEGDEYYICRDAYHSDDVYEFKGKTNKEVLDKFYTDHSCKLNQSVMSAGDFIVCKIVVKDKTKHDRGGTIKEILNQMQHEKSCKVEDASAIAAQGGGVGEINYLKGKKTKLTKMFLSGESEDQGFDLKIFKEGDLYDITPAKYYTGDYIDLDRLNKQIAEEVANGAEGIELMFPDGEYDFDELFIWSKSGKKDYMYSQGGSISGYFKGELSFLNW